MHNFVPPTPKRKHSVQNPESTEPINIYIGMWCNPLALWENVVIRTGHKLEFISINSFDKLPKNMDNNGYYFIFCKSERLYFFYNGFKKTLYLPSDYISEHETLCKHFPKIEIVTPPSETNSDQDKIIGSAPTFRRKIKRLQIPNEKRESFKVFFTVCFEPIIQEKKEEFGYYDLCDNFVEIMQTNREFRITDNIHKAIFKNNLCCTVDPCSTHLFSSGLEHSHCDKLPNYIIFCLKIPPKELMIDALETGMIMPESFVFALDYDGGRGKRGYYEDIKEKLQYALVSRSEEPPVALEDWEKIDARIRNQENFMKHIMQIFTIAMLAKQNNSSYLDILPHELLIHIASFLGHNCRRSCKESFVIAYNILPQYNDIKKAIKNPKINNVVIHVAGNADQNSFFNFDRKPNPRLEKLRQNELFEILSEDSPQFSKRITNEGEFCKHWYCDYFKKLDAKVIATLKEKIYEAVIYKGKQNGQTLELLSKMFKNENNNKIIGFLYYQPKYIGYMTVLFKKKQNYYQKLRQLRKLLIEQRNTRTKINALGFSEK